MSDIRPYVQDLKDAGNLDDNQAKTVVYYCIMTWSDAPGIRPILDLHGESGTGKNGIMKQIMPWCRETRLIVARNKTSAQLRDDLADTTTVFVDEADKTKEPRQCENWYQLRYDESGKETTYKLAGKFYKSETHNHYGYTVLHSQNVFQSIELDRRILRITIFKDSHRIYEITQDLGSKTLRHIANEVDWDKEIVHEESNSAWDVWLPLMRVAGYLGDTDFLAYAKREIRKKTESDDDTKVFEPKGIVLSETASLFLDALKEQRSHVAVTDIRQELYKRGYTHSEREIAKYARELGFTIVKPRNKAHIKVNGEARLKAILNRAGVYDDFYGEDGKLRSEP